MQTEGGQVLCFVHPCILSADMASKGCLAQNRQAQTFTEWTHTHTHTYSSLQQKSRQLKKKKLSQSKRSGNLKDKQNRTHNWPFSPSLGLRGCGVPDGQRGSDSVYTEPCPACINTAGVWGDKGQARRLQQSLEGWGPARSGLGVAGNRQSWAGHWVKVSSCGRNTNRLPSIWGFLSMARLQL